MIDENETFPSDFHVIWPLVLCMREIRDAPVDLWGCEKVVDRKAGKDIFEFQILIAAMLSSQTKDHVVKQAMDSLREAKLSLSSILSKSVEEIDSLIKMVGFHKTKARNISKVAKILQEDYSGKVPPFFEELVKLPGIGPKMANMIIACAFNQSSGIIVDTHVHRICSALRWGCRKCSACKNPEHTRLILEQWVPKLLWRDFSYLLVGLGQQTQQFPALVLERCLALSKPGPTLIFLKRIGMKIPRDVLLSVSKE